jgi:gas vesicle protein
LASFGMREYTLVSVIRAGAWGALVGGAAGFALGIVLAPEKGQKIRRRLAYQLEHLAEQIGVYVDNMVSPDDASEARRTGDAVIADARARAEDIRNDIDALLGEIRRQAPSNPSAKE